MSSSIGASTKPLPLARATLVDIRLGTRASVRLPLPAQLNAFVLVVEGELTVAAANSTEVLSPSRAAGDAGSAPVGDPCGASAHPSDEGGRRKGVTAVWRGASSHVVDSTSRISARLSARSARKAKQWDEADKVNRAKSWSD
jgi:hypothetical protein